MKERGIIFSGAMVRALLRKESPKTQTRRIVKPQPSAAAQEAGVIHSGTDSNGLWAWLDHPDLMEAGFTDDKAFRCPYGVPGDRLWVRENWRPLMDHLSECTGPKDIRYAASVSEAEWAISKWRPSIHMPRWASRLTLLVTGVRVQRLQQISTEDAAAEGWPGFNETPLGPTLWYRQLWEKINGVHSWNANPWVWAVSFEKIAESGRVAA